MPLLKIDFMSSVLALAEPVPFTVAILMEKSLTRAGVAGGMVVLQEILGCCAVGACSSSAAYGQCSSDFCMSQAAVGQRSALRPQCTHRSSSFTMTRPVCGSPADTYKGWARFFAGALRRVRSSVSAPLWV